MRRVLSICALAAACSGCVSGIKPSDTAGERPTTVFQVHASYQEAYRRFDRWAHQCHTGNWKGAWNIEGNIYSDNHTAELHIVGNGITTVSGAVKEVGHDAQVTAMVWGHGVWDERELEAIKASVLTGKPVCRE